MKKFLLFLLVILLLALMAGYSYLKFALPNTGPAPEFKITVTPERTARGKYLANNVMICMDCHSVRNMEFFSGPIIPGTEGAGGEKFDRQRGFPGDYIAPNITPAHLANWSDGDIFKAITTGVSKSGKALFPIMPYLSYGKLDWEDVYDVIAYIRTLKPIENHLQPSESGFPMSLIINTIPQKANFRDRPLPSDSVAYGGYLVLAAGCADCHTQVNDKGKPLPNMEFAGGRSFIMGDMTVHSANITPDKTSGIGNWSEGQFVSRFKNYDPASFKPQKLVAGEMQTVMPWTFFGGMEVADLKSIFQYLKTLKPINRQIERTTLKKS